MKFTALIKIIGVNPYVSVPPAVLKKIFTAAGKDKGQIPVKLIICEKEFTQTLVRYSGEWRLYLNTPMRRLAAKETGDKITIDIAYDPEERTTPMPLKLKQALAKNKAANDIFNSCSPSLQKEIMRYINNLKTPESVDSNVERAVNFLLGRERFIGRDKP